MNHLYKSIIIAAHPDDEILWFSSILNRVDEIAICFLEVDSSSECSSGRKESISAYPLANLSCLGLRESGVFDKANWELPATTKYGLEITKRSSLSARYEENFVILKEHLKEKLKHYDNVYTHNPWGEYGHEEHVQVYRAVRDLKKSMSFNLWYSNYVSNKSTHLMSKHLSTSQLTSYCLPTDQLTSSEIMQLYKKNRCWTWYDNYKWPDNECFILDEKSQSSSEMFGKTLDLNFLKVWRPKKRQNAFTAPIKRSIRLAIKKIS